ncbi:MAG: GH92 family glycosyl hydrolase [Dysgonomonas sp.]
MKKTFLFFLFAGLSLTICKAEQKLTSESKSAPVDYVNILMGSGSTYELSAGNTYPAIALPWGMNFWTPQTGSMGNGWSYKYSDTKIRGFKQTHQPSPWIRDYGQFAIMPVVGAKKINQDERASWFSHKSETATPYYYKVYLADYDVTTEMTPTERSAYFRFTFPESDSAYIVIDAFDNGSFVKVNKENNTIEGYTTKNSGGVPDNFKNYFVIKFNKPLASAEVWNDYKIVAGKNEINSNHVGAIIGFKTKRGELVEAQISSSFISTDQAYKNLQEIGKRGFDQIKDEAYNTWNRILSKIEVDGGTDDQYRTFYSCLYRSLLFPRKFYEYDVDGAVVHYSPYNGKVLPGYMYTDTGFWDTFRALFPFLNLMFPSVNTEIQEGLLNTYKESGFLPEWASPGHRDCMIGNNSASVVTDAYIKGAKVKKEDIETLYQAMVHGANNVDSKISSTGRLGYQYYNELGYVPYNVGINENAARTLEYAYDDWCIMQLGRKLGKPQKEIDVYAKRSLNYRNLFDKESKLMRGKNKDGAFQTPFNPYKWGDAFTEGNSWHYTWSVFHDTQGLIDLMGGKDNFVQMLDSVFVVPPIFDDSYYGQVIHEIREMQVMNMGNYAHGNQPIQHMIYLYNYASAPWKAQYWLREVMDKLYAPTPDGYCGDEDNGQTSVWYVFSALGFYPVCPGSEQYVLGSPLFKKAILSLENGKKIEITATSNDRKNRYVKKLTINGKEYKHNWINHPDLLNGMTMKYEMDSVPNKQRGIAKEDYPYSFSNENK